MLLEVLERVAPLPLEPLQPAQPFLDLSDELLCVLSLRLPLLLGCNVKIEEVGLPGRARDRLGVHLAEGVRCPQGRESRLDALM